jgi:hypothetical protein
MYDKMKETTDAKVGKMETIKKETHRMNGRRRVEKVNRSERKRTRGQEKKKQKGNSLLAESRQRNCCLIRTSVPGSDILFIVSSIVLFTPWFLALRI